MEHNAFDSSITYLPEEITKYDLIVVSPPRRITFSNQLEFKRKQIAEGEISLVDDVYIVDPLDPSTEGIRQQVVTVYNNERMKYHFNDVPQTLDELTNELLQSHGRKQLIVATDAKGILLGTYMLETKDEKTKILRRMVKNPEKHTPAIADFLMRDMTYRAFRDPNCEEVLLSVSATPGYLNAYNTYREWGFETYNKRNKDKYIGRVGVVNRREKDAVLETIQKRKNAPAIILTANSNNLHAFGIPTPTGKRITTINVGISNCTVWDMRLNRSNARSI